MPLVAAIVEQSWHRVPGGTATSTVRMLDRLAARGEWEVRGIAAWHRQRPADLAAPTVPVRHLPIGRRPLYELWHRYRRPALPKRLGSIDVVHATGGVIPPAGSAALVVTIHDLAFLSDPSLLTPRGVAFMTRAFALTRAEAARVIVPSEATATECVEHGLERDRIDVVPWGVSRRVADPAAIRWLRELSLPDRFALFVGTREPRKNLPRLIEATAAAGMPLVVAGPPGWGDTDVNAAHVYEVGLVSESQLAALYDAATVFAYPSLREGFGLPVLDAMGHGCAVVTSAGTATEEVVGDTGLTIDPLDTAALVDALRELWTNDDLRARFEVAGSARAAEMTWDRTARETQAVYDRVRR